MRAAGQATALVALVFLLVMAAVPAGPTAPGTVHVSPFVRALEGYLAALAAADTALARGMPEPAYHHRLRRVAASAASLGDQSARLAGTIARVQQELAGGYGDPPLDARTRADLLRVAAANPGWHAPGEEAAAAAFLRWLEGAEAGEVLWAGLPLTAFLDNLQLQLVEMQFGLAAGRLAAELELAAGLAARGTYPVLLSRALDAEARLLDAIEGALAPPAGPLAQGRLVAQAGEYRRALEALLAWTPDSPALAARLYLVQLLRWGALSAGEGAQLGQAQVLLTGLSLAALRETSPLALLPWPRLAAAVDSLSGSVKQTAAQKVSGTVVSVVELLVGHGVELAANPAKLVKVGGGALQTVKKGLSLLKWVQGYTTAAREFDRYKDEVLDLPGGIAGVRVALTAGGSVLVITASDDRGTYELRHLDRGVYRLDFSHDKYHDVSLGLSIANTLYAEGKSYPIRDGRVVLDPVRLPKLFWRSLGDHALNLSGGVLQGLGTALVVAGVIGAPASGGASLAVSAKGLGLCAAGFGLKYLAQDRPVPSVYRDYRLDGVRSVSFDGPGPALPPARDAPRRAPSRGGGTATCLVVDVSGSMEGARLTAARRAALDVLGMVAHEASAGRGEHHVALVTFATQARVEAALTGDHLLVAQAVGELRAEGRTNLGDGLRLGLRELERAAGLYPMIILLSDGAANEGLTPQAILAGPVGEAVAAGVAVHCVGLALGGADFDEDLLREIAARTGGRYFSAATAVELEGVYLRLRHGSLGEILADHRGVVGPGEVREAGRFRVEPGAGQLHLTLNWPGSLLRPVLVDPLGRTVDGRYPGALWSDPGPPTYLVIGLPLAGEWSVAVAGVEVEGFCPYDLVISSRGSAATPAVAAVLGLGLIGGLLLIMEATGHRSDRKAGIP